MTASHDDAADLLQNVFLKAWNSLDKFRGEAKLSTWLYKIAVNETLNFIKKEKSRQSTTNTSDNDEFLFNNIESDPWFDGDELKAELLKVVASLPERQRMVFRMRYFQDMKYEEISNILGISVGALKASYHHAVNKISNHFEL